MFIALMWFALGCLVMVVLLGMFVLLCAGPHRRSLLGLMGLMHFSPGNHRCHFCDLYDDERSACLVMVNLASGSRNLRTKRFAKCAWRGPMRRYVSVLDVDNEVQRLRSELSNAQETDDESDEINSCQVHSETGKQDVRGPAQSTATRSQGIDEQ